MEIAGDADPLVGDLPSGRLDRGSGGIARTFASGVDGLDDGEQRDEPGRETEDAGHAGPVVVAHREGEPGEHEEPGNERDDRGATVPGHDRVREGDDERGPDRAVRITEREVGAGGDERARENGDRCRAAQDQQPDADGEQRVTARVEVAHRCLMAGGEGGTAHLDQSRDQEDRRVGARRRPPSAFDGRAGFGHASSVGTRPWLGIRPTAHVDVPRRR